MKRPAESDLIIYAREAFRAAFHKAPEKTEVFGGGDRARSYTETQRATAWWRGGWRGFTGDCCSVDIQDSGDEWTGTASSFTKATELALEARELVPAQEVRR